METGRAALGTCNICGRDLIEQEWIPDGKDKRVRCETGHSYLVPKVWPDDFQGFNLKVHWDYRERTK